MRIICCRWLVVGVQERHCVPLAPLFQVADQADYEQGDYDKDDEYDCDDQACTAILIVRQAIAFGVQFLQRQHLFNLALRAFDVLHDHTERGDPLIGLVDRPVEACDLSSFHHDLESVSGCRAHFD